MTDPETTRLIAWSSELRSAHARLRSALQVARDAVHGEVTSAVASRDLLLYCRGFCVALDQHHRGEDRALFPAIEAAHPELATTLRQLERDHSMIDYLLAALDAATQVNAPVEEIDRHLDGIGAIMENHFAYEERQLLAVLATLALDRDPKEVLGSL